MLPDLDDEFAKANSEFETVEDLRSDMVERMGMMRIQQANMAVHKTPPRRSLRSSPTRSRSQ